MKRLISIVLMFLGGFSASICAETPLLQQTHPVQDLATQTQSAEEYRFTYAQFYRQLKHNQNPDFDKVKVGLFFIDTLTKRACRVQKAWMAKEEHYESLLLSEQGELALPIDAHLKSANPLVYLVTEKGVRCDYAFVVMSRTQLEGSVRIEELKVLLHQMQALFNELTGMFAIWVAPQVRGLTLEFAKAQQEITLEALEHLDNETLLLPNTTVRVLPLMAE